MAPTTFEQVVASSMIAEVALLRWPEQARDVERLERLAVPRLLLVAPGAVPPPSESCLQDWVRTPADEAEMSVRRLTLAARAARRTKSPRVDEYGQVTYRGRSMFLSPIDHQLVDALVERFTVVVDDLRPGRHGMRRLTGATSRRCGAPRG